MIKCVVRRCSCQSRSIQHLFDHLNKYHGNLDIYECNVGSCNRKYSVRYSFYRHLKKHYEVGDGTNNTLINNQAEKQHISRDNNENSLTHSDTPTLNTHIEKKGETKHLSTLPATLEEHLIKSQLNSMIKQMENLSIDFNLKFLSANTIPRKVVFDMQKDIQNKFLNPLCNTVNIMETLGYITSVGKDNFTKILESLKRNDTEYKFLQRLKELELYEDPKEFVISNELRPGVIQNKQQMSNDPVTGNVINRKQLLYM